MRRRREGRGVLTPKPRRDSLKDRYILFENTECEAKARNQFIGWHEASKRKNLHLIANNTRLLLLTLIHVKYLATKALSLSFRKLNAGWEKIYVPG